MTGSREEFTGCLRALVSLRDVLIIGSTTNRNTTLLRDSLIQMAELTEEYSGIAESIAESIQNRERIIIVPDTILDSNLQSWQTYMPASTSNNISGILDYCRRELMGSGEVGEPTRIQLTKLRKYIFKVFPELLPKIHAYKYRTMYARDIDAIYNRWYTRDPNIHTNRFLVSGCRTYRSNLLHKVDTNNPLAVFTAQCMWLQERELRHEYAMMRVFDPTA